MRLSARLFSLMKFLKLCVVSLAVLSQITVYASLAPVQEQKPVVDHVITSNLPQQGTLIVKLDLSYYSQKYNVPESILTYVIEHESNYNEKAIGDMNITCKRTGLPVRARGLLQITECFYPEISDECAFNAKCSLEKMLPIMADKERCISQWSTCRDYYTQLSISN